MLIVRFSSLLGYDYCVFAHHGRLLLVIAIGTYEGSGIGAGSVVSVLVRVKTLGNILQSGACIGGTCIDHKQIGHQPTVFNSVLALEL